MFNVVCCWTGPKNEKEYTIDYVHKLYRGIERNIDMEFEFYVMTDKPELFDDDKIKPIPYEGVTEGWWAKPYLFKYEFKGPVLYLDIDVVVIGNITKLIEACMKQDEFVMFRDPTTRWGNSSIMFWNGYDRYKHIYTEFAKEPEIWMSKFNRNYSGNYGDQAYIVFQNLDIIDLKELGFDQWWCDSSIVYDPGVDNAQFIILAGPKQKPHNVDRTKITDLVKEHWI